MFSLVGRMTEGGELVRDGWTAFVGRSVYRSFYSDRHN